MKNLRVTSRQHGLTLWQWGLLFAAFMFGLGGTFIVREIFPPASVYAGMVQPAPANPVSVR